MNRTATDIVQEVTQSLIALLVIGGSLAVLIMMIMRGQDANAEPNWLIGLAFGVAGFYFGARNNNATIATLTNGPLHLIASMNQRAPRRATDPPTADAPGDVPDAAAATVQG